MKKTVLTFALPVALAAGLLSPASASAAGLDFDRNQFFIISAERMFGFSYTTDKSERDVGGTTVTDTSKTTNISLLSRGDAVGYNIPSVGLHYSVIPALTLGANLGLSRTSTSSESEGGGQTVTVDGKPVTSFLVAPRVGYILGFSDAFYFWIRGGVTYVRSSSEDETTQNNVTITTKNSSSRTAISLDPMFVFTPVNRFGITIGPVIDIGVGGGTKSESTSGSTTQTTETDHTMHNFGLQFGILGYI